MSLENRLRIRPEGVVSKNDIGSRRIFTSNLLWISFDAIMAPRARENDANSTRIDCPTPSAAYTPRYPPLQGKTKQTESTCTHRNPIVKKQPYNYIYVCVQKLVKILLRASYNNHTDVESDIFPGPLSSAVLHSASQMLVPTPKALYPILNSRANKHIEKVHDLMYSHTTDSLTC